CFKIPSYRRLLLASALAYFFFSSVRGFAMIYFQQHYGLSHEVVVAAAAIIGLGALAGVLSGGRISEYLLRHGRISARVVVPTIALFVSIPLLGFGIWTSIAWLGILVLTIGGLVLGIAIAPVEAARLDVIQSHIWGRAESGRAALRYFFEGISPLLLGAISGWIGGKEGLTWGFLIMLISIVLAGIIAVPLRNTYPRDVATAAAAERKMDEKEENHNKDQDQRK
ncbi:MAG TPA: hypothetical protein VFJ18_13025, partial [Pararhizobium sp.]|nr:hypothetical protein [Pararhizobium sp.]